MKKKYCAAILTLLLTLGLAACSDTQAKEADKDIVSGGESVEKTVKSNDDGHEAAEGSEQEGAQSEVQSGVSNDHKVISTDGRFYGEWLDEGWYGVKYQGSGGYIIAIFNRDGVLDHFKEFDGTGDLTWSCDWQFYDVRDDDHEYCVGYNHTTGENIMRTYDLDYELIWPMEYEEYQPDLVAVNQQFVTVAGDKFTLWWRSWHDSEDGYYYKFEDRNFSKVEEGK